MNKAAVLICYLILIPSCENPVNSAYYTGSVQEYGAIRVWMRFIEQSDTIGNEINRALDITLFLTHVAPEAIVIDSSDRRTLIELYNEKSMLPLWASPTFLPNGPEVVIKKRLEPSDTVVYMDRCILSKNGQRFSPGIYDIYGRICGFTVPTMRYEKID